MISYSEYARTILLGGHLEDKLLETSIEWGKWESFELPGLPGRTGPLSFSDNRYKFPRAVHLNEADKKAMALHSFANHELLAMEMMAAAILIYPHQTEDDLRFKKGIVTALKDEQKHLQLYIGRINELGYAFGDFPLNDFFWRQMPKLKTASQYTALMALTLDFAQYYAQIFKGFGDFKTASILETVLADEITHVAFGAHWLKRWRSDKSLWNYYRESLPWPLTPARSKGIAFDPIIHAKAMGDDEFMQELVAYEDEFKVTKRRE
jgi:hypothetical protein